MNDQRDGTSGSESASAEDVFVELLEQIIDRLDRQEEKLDALIKTVAELREEQERQADVQEEFDDRVSVAIESAATEAWCLADYQFKTHNVAREVYGQQAADYYSGLAMIELLKILTTRIDDETVETALKRALEKGGHRGRAWVQTMLEFDNIHHEQKKNIPSVRASLERDWKLNRKGLMEARLAEREKAAREAEAEAEAERGREEDEERER